MAQKSAFQKILRRPVVEARTGLSRSTIYVRILKGTFPKPISLGQRAVGWIEAEIDAWIEQQIEKSRETQTQRLDDLLASIRASHKRREEP